MFVSSVYTSFLFVLQILLKFLRFHLVFNYLFLFHSTVTLATLLTLNELLCPYKLHNVSYSLLPFLFYVVPGPLYSSKLQYGILKNSQINW